MCSAQTARTFANEARDSQYYLLIKSNKADIGLTSWHHCNKTKTKCETDGREEEKDYDYYLGQSSPAVLNLTSTDKRQRKVSQVRLSSSKLPLVPPHIAIGLVNSAAPKRPHMAGGLGRGDEGVLS